MPKDVAQKFEPLRKFLPENSMDEIIKLLLLHPIRLKVTKPRKTRLGTYSQQANGQDVITVNGDLNPYAFLVTLLHEFAHLIAFKQYGFKIRSHGKEWQETFASLLKPFLEQKLFPKEIIDLFERRGNQLSASQCTDPELYSLLRKYDKGNHNESVSLLKDLDLGTIFQLVDGPVFKKLKVNRTRAVCEMIKGNKPGQMFTVSLLAKVIKIEAPYSANHNK